MRKRNHLIWPLGLALALTVTGVAWANGTQSLSWGIKPTKLSKTVYKPVKLTVSAALSPQASAPADQSPSDVKLAFPKDIKFNASGIGKCAESTIMNGGSCPSSDIVGRGISRIYGPRGNSLLPLLTLYNGRTSSKGTPTVILQGEFPPDSGVIDGTFSKKTGGTLDIAFPAFAGGRADMTSFTFTFTKPGYASARVSSETDLKTVFTYAASGQRVHRRNRLLPRSGANSARPPGRGAHVAGRRTCTSWGSALRPTIVPSLIGG